MESRCDDKLLRFNSLFNMELEEDWEHRELNLSKPVRIVPISTTGVYPIVHACVKQLATQFKNIDIPLTNYHLAVVTASQIHRKKLLDKVLYGKDVAEKETFVWSKEDVSFFSKGYETVDENLKPIVDYIDHIGMFEIDGQMHIPGDRKVNRALLPLVNCHYNNVWRAANFQRELTPEDYERNKNLELIVHDLEEVLPWPPLDDPPSFEQSIDFVVDLFSECRRKLDEHSWLHFLGTIDFKSKGSVAQLVGSEKMEDGRLQCWSIQSMPLHVLVIGGIYGFGRVLTETHPTIYSREVAAVISDPFHPKNLISRLIHMHERMHNLTGLPL